MSNQAEVYFFQQYIDNAIGLQYFYGLQLVVDQKILVQETSYRTGNFNLTRQRIRECGRAVGEELKKHGESSFKLITDKRFDEIPNPDKLVRSETSNICLLEDYLTESINDVLKK